ncbi:MAG: hypothetical protein WAW17_23005 [Rhodococcus sp. (in: high G+C Gram-positive bacteria)]|uniref:hypothetical protein n=1 Tax=Rhodococcus sp. TaxID=1831 RepID=UPI003BB05B7F
MDETPGTSTPATRQPGSTAGGRGAAVAALRRAVLEAVGAVIDGSDGRTASPRPKVLIDTHERWASIDDWVRIDLLPRLPATALAVVASRTPESLEYLRAVGAPPRMHERICQVTPRR